MIHSIPGASGNLTDHFDHSFCCRAVIANDFVDFLSEKIAHRSPDQIRLLKETAGGRFLTNELLDQGPLIEKKPQVPHEIPRPLTFAYGADNDSDAVGNF
jgi:hypothetical protein